MKFKGDDTIGPIIAKYHVISCRREMLSEFTGESVKSNIDVINELNIHRLKLGDFCYDPCPGMSPIVNVSRTFHKKNLLINANCTR